MKLRAHRSRCTVTATPHAERPILMTMGPQLQCELTAAEATTLALALADALEAIPEPPSRRRRRTTRNNTVTEGEPTP